MKMELHNLDLKDEYEKIKNINESYQSIGYEFQQNRINDLIKHVTTNVKAYQSFKGCSLQDFPITNKQIILNDKQSYIVPEEILDEEKYYTKTTSGSSGTPFTFYQDKGCRTKLTACLKYWNHVVGISEEDMILHMRSLTQYYKGPLEKKDLVLDKKLNIIYVDNANMTEEKLEKVCKLIYENHVRMVRGYFSSVDALTEYALNHDFKLTHEGEKLLFMSNGELLSEKVKKRVIDKLGYDIVSQYGSEELGVLGMSEINQPGNVIKLDLSNHYVELLKLNEDKPAEDGELGRIVVTDLSNYAMPFVRYDIGDLAVRGELINGSVVTLKQLAGRQTDMICRTDNTFIDFFNSCPSSIHDNENISQWQFIQKTQRDYLLILKPSDESVYNQKDRFTEDLRHVLGRDANIIIQFENNIPVEVSGKRRVIINEYRKRHGEI